MSPLGEWTAVPWLMYEDFPAAGGVIAAVVTLDAGTAEYPPDPVVAVSGASAVVRWSDGVATAVELPDVVDD